MQRSSAAKAASPFPAGRTGYDRQRGIPGGSVLTNTVCSAHTEYVIPTAVGRSDEGFKKKPTV